MVVFTVGLLGRIVVYSSVVVLSGVVVTSGSSIVVVGGRVGKTSSKARVTFWLQIKARIT